jgi:hypothetical protein
VVGFHWKVKATQADNLIRFMHSSTEQIQLETTAGGELEIRRGSTLLEVSSGLGLTTDTWYHIEVKVLIHQSAGEIEVRVDEVAVIGPTGTLDTQADATYDVINNIQLIGDVTSDPTFDHLIIMDQAGLKNNDFLGQDVVVETLAPVADGTTNDWTPLSGLTNYEMVDEANPDDLTSYVSTSTVDDTELYDMTDITRAITVVHGVQARCCVSRELATGAGPREMRMVARSGVTDYEGAIWGTSLGWKFIDEMWEDDPDGGDWDETSVNAAEFGFTVES